MMQIITTLMISLEYKLQVLANLANFGYDPVNYEHFRKLNVFDLFLGEFSSNMYMYEHTLVLVGVASSYISFFARCFS